MAGEGSRDVAGRPSSDSRIMLMALVVSELALVAAIEPPQDDGAGLRALLTLAFWLTSPGAVIVSRLWLTPLTKVAVAPLLGLALLIATALCGTWVGPWAPRASMALVAGATAVVAGRRLFAALRAGGTLVPTWVRPGQRLPRPSGTTVLLSSVLLVDLVAWWVVLPAVRAAPPSVLGLLVAGPRVLPAVILAAVVVLLVALRGGRPLLVTAAAGTLVVVLRTTMSAASSVPPFSYTYKHVGVVGYLQEHHQVLGNGTDIYMNWPGMFAASAYFADGSGLTVLDLARWITPVVHVLLALETAALARALGATPTGSAAAASLVVVLNWEGQDYFAPQAVAMCFAAGVLVLLVRSGTSRTCAALACVLYAVVIVTHQLTPFWLLALTIALAVLRQVPWWVPAAMGAIAAVYLGTHLEAVETYGVFSGFDPLGNARSNVPPVPALGRDVAGVFAKGTTVVMWLSTFGILAHRVHRLGSRRGWRAREVLVPAAIAFSPFVLLGGQDYGGEAVLRVTLYSTLGCCAVLGPALARAMTTRRAPVFAATAWTLVVAAASAQLTYGSWSWNLMRPEEVAAARWLADQPDAAVIPVDLNWPGRASADYATFIQSRTREEQPLNEILAEVLPADPYESGTPVPLRPEYVEAAVRQGEAKPTYVVFTNGMRQFDAYYSIYAPGSYQSTLEGLTASQDWRVVRQEGDVWVLRFVGPGWPAE